MGARAGRGRYVICAIVSIGVLWLGWTLFLDGRLGLTFTRSVDERNVFFRLKASYLHAGERVDFDIVAGCSVRITNYKDSGSSFDAFRDPLFFVKATQDGGAILQIVPNACNGGTTENGNVPKDFLPGAIWYDDKNDRILGIGYVTEDAFENPKSKLKFIGATITKATRAEWEEFQPINAQNLGDPRAYSRDYPQPSQEERRANAWNKQELAAWMPNFHCFGVARYHLSDDDARELIRSYWPSSKPQFWVPSDSARKRLDDELYAPHKVKDLLIDGVPYSNLIFRYEQAGFPTRVRGGTTRPASDWGYALPSKIYPVRADIGLPWMRPSLTSAPELYYDVDMRASADGANVYCYSVFNGATPGLDVHFPDFFGRRFTTRVDGEVVEAPAGEMSAMPQGFWRFYERDEYFHTEFEFDLF